MHNIFFNLNLFYTKIRKYCKPYSDSLYKSQKNNTIAIYYGYLHESLIFKSNVVNYSLDHNLLQAYMTSGENTLYRVRIVRDLSWLKILNEIQLGTIFESK